MSVAIWIIGAVIVAALMVLFKMKELRHQTGLIVIALILLFLVISFSQVYKVNKPNLKSFDGIMDIVKVYFSWLGTIFKNVGHITGYAVHLDWGVNVSNAVNITNSTLANASIAK